MCGGCTSGRMRGSADLGGMGQAVFGLGATSVFTDTSASELPQFTVYVILYCHCKFVEVFTLNSLFNVLKGHVQQNQ